MDFKRFLSACVCVLRPSCFYNDFVVFVIEAHILNDVLFFIESDLDLSQREHEVVRVSAILLANAEL